MPTRANNIPSSLSIFLASVVGRGSYYVHCYPLERLFNETRRDHLSSDPVPSTSTPLTNLTLPTTISHIFKHSRPVESVQDPGSSLVDTELSSGRYMYIMS
jgi:hypothetical protein